MADSRVLSIKLLIDSETNRVMFAEAGKDFVDFLINLITLPVASVIKLLKTGDMIGSVGNIYQSLETIGDTYLLSIKRKDPLTNPTVPALTTITNRLLGNQLSRTQDKFYICHSRNCYYMSNNQSETCPGCRQPMYVFLKFVDHTGSVSFAESIDEGGFVKDAVTYMVMDDLMIQPVSCFTMLDKFKIKDVGILQEKIVDIGISEGLKLLKASLYSKTVLSDVFLPKLDNCSVLKSEMLGYKSFF